MTKYLITVLLSLVSYSVFAESAVSFNPTPSDVSVVFLGNIFGTVDGVLAGSGSQIIGQMFGIFNSAVLALGGIILMYTLLVSTMNTAHEGQFLGQKWSSIWVPIRSTVGIGLILPKASGYCMMQIFVMWVVLQGVGAADSIWKAALSYLNTGGAIVMKQMDPNTSAETDGGAIMNAAMGMTAAQVCLQALESSYADLLQLQKQPNGSCQDITDSSNWFKFCNMQVPDFMNSVQIADETRLTESTAGSTQTISLPNFATEQAPYNSLNGICGKLSWKVFSPPSSDSLSTAEKSGVKNARTMAVATMWNQLIPLTNAMIDNSASFNSSLNCNSGTGSSSCVLNNPGSRYKYGVPLNNNYSAQCTSRQAGGQFTYSAVENTDSAASDTSWASFTDNTSSIASASPDNNACIVWANTDETTALFNGTELQGAVAAYNGIMQRVITAANLLNSGSSGDYSQARSFIREAESQGWLMAGAYFFRLAILNSYVVDASGGGNAVDSDSGLKVEDGTSTGGNWNVNNIKKELTAGTNCFVSGDGSDALCGLASNTLANLVTLTKGNVENLPTAGTTDGQGNETPSVYNYLINANALVLPTQTTVLNAGLNNFARISQFNPSMSVPKMGSNSFSGGKWGIAGDVSTILWNGIVKPLWNMILELIMPPIMELFSMMISPIVGMSAHIFSNALDVMRQEGVNPIIALANMGTKYIDGVGNAWIAIIVYATPALLFLPAFALIMMLMPVVFAWMGIMLGVGFSAAYYVPFVPLLVFSFAGIGWMIGVIEAMVAAPIVGLGVTHPEGHEAFGKADQAIMLILNMFLRPSMMILGYIFGIILSYVGVWIMNAGFNLTVHDVDRLTPISSTNIVPEIDDDASNGMYGFWSKIMLFYFTILTYSTLYISVVQQAFQLIYYLPDKVLRWLSGGVAEQLGEGAVQGMQQDVKGRSDEAGKAGTGAMAKTTSGLMAGATGGAMDAKEGGGDEGGGESEAEGGDEEGGSASGGAEEES